MFSFLLRLQIQEVRSDLWKASSSECQTYFSKPLPFSKCNKKDGSKPLQRHVERGDINCEMLTWQYETLGDGNTEEFKYNNCPLPKRKATESEGAARKRQEDEHETEERGQDEL